MTGLIGSLVGAASTAVERLAGTLAPRTGGGGQGENPVGEFAALLATMSGSGRVKGAGPGVLRAAATPDQELAAEVDAEQDGTEE
ncbi:MAG: hypothetical protein WD766_02980, partial [Gemmatimonadota bacterium]